MGSEKSKNLYLSDGKEKRKENGLFLGSRGHVKWGQEGGGWEGCPGDWGRCAGVDKLIKNGDISGGKERGVEA